MVIFKCIKLKYVWVTILLMVMILLIVYGIPKNRLDIISKENALKDYDAMWEILEKNYPFFPVIRRKYFLSADAVKEGYRKDILDMKAQYMDFDDYYKIIDACLDTMHQIGHLEILTPDKYRTELKKEEVYKSEGDSGAGIEWRYQLYKDPQVKKRYRYLEKNKDVDSNRRKPIEETHINTKNLEFMELGKDIAYVKIKSFDISHMSSDREKLYTWFKENTERKIIIDITKNGGGTDSYWKELIVAPNINESLESMSYYLTPFGEETQEQLKLDGVSEETLTFNLDKLYDLPQLNKDDLECIAGFGTAMRRVSPAFNKPLCDGPFYVLVGPSTYSSADGFAMFCKNTKFATVVGENTGGDGGGRNVSVVKLPISGLLLRFRAMHVLNPDGSSNVEFGTTPDVTPKEKGKRDASYLGLCLDYIKGNIN